MTREDIEASLRHFGFTDLLVAHDQCDHPNGPACSILARR
jgi:hypothetical protein